MRSFWERRTLKERAFEKCNPVLTAAVFCHIVTVLSHFSTSVSDSRCELDPKYQLCVHIEYLTFLTHFVEIFRLFAVGGRDGSSCLRSMECFDPHTNKWSMCAPMSKRRGGVGVATYNNFLYAVGGHDAPASNHCSRLSDCVERWVHALAKAHKHRHADGIQSWVGVRLPTHPDLHPVPACWVINWRDHSFHRGFFATASGAIWWS